MVIKPFVSKTLCLGYKTSWSDHTSRFFKDQNGVSLLFFIFIFFFTYIFIYFLYHKNKSYLQVGVKGKLNKCYSKIELHVLIITGTQKFSHLAPQISIIISHL